MCICGWINTVVDKHNLCICSVVSCFAFAFALHQGILLVGIAVVLLSLVSLCMPVVLISNAQATVEPLPIPIPIPIPIPTPMNLPFLLQGPSTSADSQLEARFDVGWWLSKGPRTRFKTIPDIGGLPCRRLSPSCRCNTGATL